MRYVAVTGTVWRWVLSSHSSDNSSSCHTDQGAETWAGRTFLCYQSNVWGILIFSSDRSARLLQTASEIYVNRTFKVNWPRLHLDGYPWYCMTLALLFHVIVISQTFTFTSFTALFCLFLTWYSVWEYKYSLICFTFTGTLNQLHFILLFIFHLVSHHFV
jgi:hypothetical protein